MNLTVKTLYFNISSNEKQIQRFIPTYIEFL